MVWKNFEGKEGKGDTHQPGFPCTLFSKAGSMKGLKHKDDKLFDRVIEIIEKYNDNHKDNEISTIILENVAFLANHNKRL